MATDSAALDAAHEEPIDYQETLLGWPLERWRGRLYGTTLLLELPGAVIRFGVTYFFALLLLLPIAFVFGESLLRATVLGTRRPIIFDLVLWGGLIIAAIVALWPFAASLLASERAGGFLFTRFMLGARDPSRREREAVVAAFAHIEENADGEIVSPTEWFVVDENMPNAYTIGTTLYLSRELIRSPHLAAVLAHEFGHVNNGDGQMTLALRRLVLPPVYLLSQASSQVAPGNVTVIVTDNTMSAYLQIAGVWLLSFLLSMAGGGFGLWLLNPLWVWFWRQREYEADLFAARCGFARELIEHLEQHQYFDVATPYFLSSHPYTELRIDRLLAYEEGGIS